MPGPSSSMLSDHIFTSKSLSQLANMIKFDVKHLQVGFGEGAYNFGADWIGTLVVTMAT